jgi:ADP-heptose:LPS heptosyltransferase
MFVASFNDYLDILGWQLQPGTSYVLSKSAYDMALAMLERHGVKDPTDTWSGFNCFERRYAGHALHQGNRLAIYRERGLGDALMVTGLVHWIRHENPEARISVHSMPMVRDIWANNPDAEFIGQAPTYEGMVNPKVMHLFFENMVEANNRREQENVYDIFLNFSGYQAAMVPREFKRPHLVMGEQDAEMLSQWREARKHERYVVWQWAPSGTNRMYPPELAEQAIRLLAEQIHVIIVGVEEMDVPMPAIDHPNVNNAMTKTPTFHHLIPLVRDAACVVGPDSCLLHLAGAFPEVPAVGLWGAFAPADRVKYYDNVLNLTAEAVCPFSPCRAQFSALPMHLCQAAAGFRGDEQKWCAVMEWIKPEDVAKATLKHAR